MNAVSQKGYTVLEVLIVIAVSGSMFVMVAIVFGGRQQQIQFTQAVRSLDSKLQDTINDVSSGYYDNSGVRCDVDDSDPSARPEPNATVLTPGSQGSSDDCVFIGKAIQFAPNEEGVTDVEQPSTIYIYNIVGRRNNNGSVSNIHLARPKAVGSSTATDTYNLDSQVAKLDLDWGLQVTDIVDSGTNEYGTIGFFTTFSRSFNIGSGPTVENVSNNQYVRFGAIPFSQLGEESHQAVSKINLITDQNLPTAPEQFIDLSGSNPITICLKRNDDNKRAAIVIGASGTTSTTIQFDDYDGSKCDS